MDEESDEKLEDKKELRKHRVQDCLTSDEMIQNPNETKCNNHMITRFSLPKQIK